MDVHSFARVPRRWVAPALLVGPLLAGCPGRTNTTEIAQHITLQPVAAGSYLGYTGTSFSEQIPSDKKVLLTRATIASSTGELSWLASITGSAGSAAGGAVLVSKTSFAGAHGTADLDVVDTGDILPLYPTQDFAVYWVIDFASVSQSYPQGIELTVTYEIEID